MTNSTVVTYTCGSKSVTFSPDSNFWLSEITGLSTDIEISSSQNANGFGQPINSQYIKGKTITFTGDLHGDLLLTREHLLSCILPGENATIFFNIGDKTLYISGYPTKTPEIEVGAAIQSFQFEFFAPYPYFKTTETKSYLIAGINPFWQTPFFMQNDFWISRFTENSFVKVTNSGNVAQAFTLDIYATSDVTHPTIHNISANSLISINKSMLKGDRLRISTHDKDKDTGDSIIFQSQDSPIENGFRFISPESNLDMKILPGSNIFLVDAEENITNIQCTIITAGGEYHSI